MTINPKDIPFMPGTIFVDPRKTDFKKAHVLDKSTTSVSCNDDKAMTNPMGSTSNPLCARGTLQIDPTKLTLERVKVAGQKVIAPSFDPARTSTRGVIGCRTGLITEAPEGAQTIDKQSPFNTSITRDHDAERKFAKQVD